MFSSTPERVWAVVMFAVSAFALWRGGRTERAVAVANIVAWIATIVVQNRHDWLAPQWGVLAVDVLFLLLLLWFVVRSSRLWILPAAAFQLLAVVTHAAILADGGGPGLGLRDSLDPLELSGAHHPGGWDLHQLARS